MRSETHQVNGLQKALSFAKERFKTCESPERAHRIDAAGPAADGARRTQLQPSPNFHQRRLSARSLPRRAARAVSLWPAWTNLLPAPTALHAPSVLVQAPPQASWASVAAEEKRKRCANHRRASSRLSLQGEPGKGARRERDRCGASSCSGVLFLGGRMAWNESLAVGLKDEHTEQYACYPQE